MDGKIIKVEVVTGGTNQPTLKRELTGAELKKWIKEHTNDSTKNESQSDTDRETDSDTRESE